MFKVYIRGPAVHRGGSYLDGSSGGDGGGRDGWMDGWLDNTKEHRVHMVGLERKLIFGPDRGGNWPAGRWLLLRK